MGAEWEGKNHVVEERDKQEEDKVDDLERRKKKSSGGGGAEIDTSAPFHSVKDALSLFGGGIAFSKPSSSSQHDLNTMDIHSVGRLDKSPLDFILMQLQQAVLNLIAATNDLAHIRSTVDSYNTMIEKERNLLQDSRQRLSSTASNVSSLEEKINQTRDKLKLVQDANVKGYSSHHTMNPETELYHLNSESDRFMIIAAAAKSQVSKAMCQIEQTNSMIKTAEMRFIAANTIKEAAKATEAVALADITTLSSSQISPDDSCQQQNPARITLSLNEYDSLTSRALRVDEADVSQTEILKRVEQVTNEVKNSKDILEEALNRFEAANRGKLAVIRKLRSENGKKRRSTTKFKNTHLRKVSRVLDVNVPNIMTNDLKPATRPTLSIGQIMSRKLLLSEEFGHSARVKPTVSLGQMLGKTSSDTVHYLSQKRDIRSDHKLLPSKRMKFGFFQISLFVKKRHA